MDLHAGLCLICALVTLGVTIVCSVYGKKMLKMIPFICGILSGYLLATCSRSSAWVRASKRFRSSTSPSSRR